MIVKHMQHDRTKTALQRQLRGLGQDRFELTIRGPDRTSVFIRSPAEILSDLDKLKRANRAGCHLYIRGVRDIDHDLILLDDLDRFTPERMKAAGHAPAVVVETSPGNLQAWIRLGVTCPADVRHEVARDLARKYGGDPGAVDPHQSGRLAGFTNQKPEHKTGRGFPYVLLLNAPGKPAAGAQELIRSAEDALATKRRTASQVRSVALDGGSENPTMTAAWVAGYSKAADLSAVDWSQTHELLASGVDPADITATLEAAADRKGKNARAYAERTVRKALEMRDASQTPEP
ncbi:MAG: RepB family DNA primase [Oceanicaulis sp.]|nr:RepB family DNA primase [Oceanicaulis sp.]